MPVKPVPAFDPAGALLAAFATNNRINQYLIENLSDEAWTASSPGGKGRNVAAIFTHIHNVRLMWLKSVGVLQMPSKLDPDAVTRGEAAAVLNEASLHWLRSFQRLCMAMGGSKASNRMRPVSRHTWSPTMLIIEARP